MKKWLNLWVRETTEISLKPASEITVIMMCGLQGAGKTTTTAKIAGKLKSKGKKAITWLPVIFIVQQRLNSYRLMVKNKALSVFSMGDKHKPVNIAKAAMEHAAKNGNNVVILDTAGRLHIDEDMMDELKI